MRTLVAVAALVLLTACGGDTDAPDTKATSTSVSADDAAALTCKEVRAGIDDFNRQDYAGTVEHFEKAKIPAKVYAKVNQEPEADALLDAVQYYAGLAPAKYPDAARSSQNFARNKAITLEQCASGEPIDESPGTEV